MNSIKLLLRFLIVGGLLLVLLIPLLMISSTISERERYRDRAVYRVGESYAKGQTLLGPALVIPWSEEYPHESQDADGKLHVERRTRDGRDLYLPQILHIKGELEPDRRRIGLFQVPVYHWHGKIDAGFLTLPPVSGRVYGRAYLALGISDVRGLVGNPTLNINGESYTPLPGSRVLEQQQSGGLHVLLNEREDAWKGREVQAEIAFVLAGTRDLSIVPLGDETQVQLSSSWPHPLFDGSFLPNERSIGADGFNAHWAISSLATRAQRQVRQQGSDVEALRVNLVDPVDVYTLANRASKYGILFVVLTFVGFVMLELIKRLRIHPLQYLLVGLALAIFFLLLLSLSEHIAFWQAYVIAALACIGLQGAYLAGVLRDRRYGLAFSGMLGALYAALYLLLQSEGYALLLGSLLLFVILGTIMWLTRKLDWYEIGMNLR